MTAARRQLSPVQIGRILKINGLSADPRNKVTMCCTVLSDALPIAYARLGTRAARDRHASTLQAPAPNTAT